jgi:hypothetical protein
MPPERLPPPLHKTPNEATDSSNERNDESHNNPANARRAVEWAQGGQHGDPRLLRI